MKKRQAGMTTLGLIILVSFVGLFAFAGIRLAPVYLNYMKIVGVVDGVRDEFDGAGASRSQIQSSISRRFDIESVGIITARDVKVTKVEGGHEVAATYSHKAPFIANVSFVVDFDKRTLVRR
jgi:CBS domain-containing protein